MTTTWSQTGRTPELLEIKRAKERLRQIGPDDVGKLLNQLNNKAFTDYLRRLPRIRGFNRGTEGERQRQKREIVKVATANLGGEHNPYWDAYRFAWFCATAQRLGTAWPFTFDDERLQGDEASALLVETLVHTNGSASPRRVSRETIEEVLAFSPLDLVDRATSIVSRARSASDIEREQLMEEIPARLNSLTDLIDRYGAELKQAQQLRIDAAYAIDRRIENILSELSKTHTDFAHLLADVERRVSQSIGATNDVEKAVWEFDHRLVQLETNSEKDFAVHAIDEFQTRLDALTAQLSQIENALTAPTGLPPITFSEPTPKQASDTRRPSDGSVARYVLKHTKQADGATPAIEIRSWSTIWAAFRDNLTYLGLSAADAVLYGLTLTAAMRARQMPILGGSIAQALAPTLYLRVVGGANLLIDIPIGCRQPLDLAAVREWDPRSVLISGLSRAPFEVIGGDIRTSVLRCQMGWASHAPRVVVATFEPGPTALPLSATILESGPYLDLDAVSWTRRAAPALPGSQIAPGFLDSRRNDAVTEQSALNEIDEDIAAMELITTAAWRASMRRFFYALAWTAKETAAGASIDGAILSDVMYRSWIVPLLAAEEQDLVKRDERLSKVNTALSAKVKKLLRAPTMRPW